jgi:signal transduction histidine kinase/CheY-like chemotaxis protein
MRRPIALVIAAGLLPIIALSGAFGIITLRAERVAVRNGADAATRAIATLASVKLTDGMHEVNMIAQSPAFDGSIDDKRFRTLAMRLQHAQANWRFLSVADPSGRRLLDVPEPIGGQEGGPVIDMASLRQAVATRRPVVGNIMRGPLGNYAFAIRAPVIRDGQVRYVVSAVIPAQAATRLLKFRELPPGWRVGLLDGTGRVIASTTTDPEVIGSVASEAGRAARRSGRTGFYDVTRSDGSAAIAIWQPIAGTNWSAHLSVPVAAYAPATTRAWTLLGMVMIICVALVAALTRLLVNELRQLQARETAAVQHQRLEALGRLTGGVAHDFNNLLQPVMGGLDLLSRRVQGDEKALGYIALAMTSAERARSLVARLLSFSRQQPLTSAPVDVGRMLSDIEHLLERSISPATLEVKIAEGLPLIQADASQLELAILNLAINARDAMPDGGTVAIAAAIIDVTKADDLASGRYVAISVTDTGTGMDAATIRHAIDPFFTTKPADKGTGLGLSMVHGFAVQSGGALRLSSTPGVGTKASIVLPLAVDQAPLTVPSTGDVPEGKAHILLVDDDVQVRRAVSEMLRDAGHRVAEAESVDKALGILGNGDRFDIVVTDYLMPDRNGGQLIAELGRLAPSLPVLMITGHDSLTSEVPDTVPRLVKPFRAGELLAKVHGLLDGKQPLVEA